METRDRIQYGLEAYKQVQDLVRFVDTKASVLTGLYVLGANLFFARVKDLDVHRFAQFPLVSVLLLLCVAWFLGQTAFQIAILLSRIVGPRTSHPESGSRNLFFYGHAAEMPLQEYIEDATRKSEAQVMRDLYAQLHEVSRIATKKVQHLNQAMRSWWYSLVPLLGFYLLSYCLIADPNQRP